MAQYRQVQVVTLLRQYGMGAGAQARIARDLSVSRATICRDVQALFAAAHGCPVCGQPMILSPRQM